MHPIGAILFANRGINLILKIRLQIEATPINPKHPKAIKDGKTNDEIYEFLTERYGDFILLKPSFKLNTFLLWLLPFIFLSIGIFLIFFHDKKSKEVKK